VEGSGTITGPSGDQASFSINLHQQNSKKKSGIVGSFNYSDPAASLSINGSKISSLTFSGNSAHFTGTSSTGKSAGKKGKGGKGTISFTVDVTDNGSGTSDTFSIQTSTGYSASGNLTSGDVTIH
jgi:hypothetical protein